MLKVKIKKLHPNAVIPSYAKAGDAGMDLTAVSCKFEDGSDCHVYGTGLSVEIPEGYVGLVFPRSSLSKYSLILSNHVGVIDSGYRGEITLKFKELDLYGGYYDIGDRIGQLIIMPYPQIEFVESENLSETERGSGGYGSSGN